MQIKCPGCAAALAVADGVAGKNVRCPKCNHTFPAVAAMPPAAATGAPAAPPRPAMMQPPAPPVVPTDLPVQPPIPTVIPAQRPPRAPPPPSGGVAPPPGAWYGAPPRRAGNPYLAVAIIAIAGGALRFLITASCQGNSLFFSLLFGWSQAHGTPFMDAGSPPEQPGLWFNFMGGVFVMLLIVECVFNLVSAALMIVCGLGLIQGRSWSRPVLLVVCVASAAFLFVVVLYEMIVLHSEAAVDFSLNVSLFSVPYGVFGLPMETRQNLILLTCFLHLALTTGLVIWLLVLGGRQAKAKWQKASPGIF